MPDYLELLRGLLSALGPREAEAKMFPMDDRASRMIKLQREAQAPAPGSPEAKDPLTGAWFSPERRALYQDIGRATEAHPETVEVSAPRTWDLKDITGLYYPDPARISMAPMEYQHFPKTGIFSRRPPGGVSVIRPPSTVTNKALPTEQLGSLPVQDVLAHEQLHFLMQTLMQAEEAERYAATGEKGPPPRWQDRETPWNVEKDTAWSGTRQAFDDELSPSYGESYDTPQHQLIAYLLGGNTAEPRITQGTYPEPMSGTHPPPTTPEIADAYRRLIHQIFPEGKRRERALAGLGASRGGTLLEELR